MQRQQVQYVHQQPPPPQQQQQQQQQQPPRQYVRGPNGGVYMANVNAAPPMVQQHPQHQQPMMMRPMVTTTTMPVPAQAPPVTTLVKRTKIIRDDNDNDTPVRVVHQEAGAVAEGHKMVVNALLAGFLLQSFHTDGAMLDKKESNVLALKIVSFGCFLSALSFYALYLQYGRKRYMRSWVYCAQLISMIGLLLLVSAVAMTTRMQLGEDYETAWIGSVAVMIILVSLPILFDIVWCISRLVGDLVDWFDDMF